MCGIQERLGYTAIIQAFNSPSNLGNCWVSLVEGVSMYLGGETDTSVSVCSSTVYSSTVWFSGACLCTVCSFPLAPPIPQGAWSVGLVLWLRSEVLSVSLSSLCHPANLALQAIRQPMSGTGSFRTTVPDS